MCHMLQVRRELPKLQPVADVSGLSSPTCTAWTHAQFTKAIPRNGEVRFRITTEAERKIAVPPKTAMDGLKQQKMIALRRAKVEDNANRPLDPLQSDFAKGDARLRAEVAEARDS